MVSYFHPANTCNAHYLGQTRQINQRQTQDMWRVYLEIDGLTVDPLVGSCYSRRLILDFPLDILEVCELAPRDMMELCPFSLRCRHASWCVRDVDFVVHRSIFFAGYVDKLQDEGSSSDYAAAARKKVPPNDVLKY